MRSWWYGRAPRLRAGGGPITEAAASPQALAAAKTPLFIQKVFECKWSNFMAMGIRNRS
jgi:hypothetical protein